MAEAVAVAMDQEVGEAEGAAIQAGCVRGSCRREKKRRWRSMWREACSTFTRTGLFTVLSSAKMSWCVRPYITVSGGKDGGELCLRGQGGREQIANSEKKNTRVVFGVLYVRKMKVVRVVCSARGLGVNETECCKLSIVHLAFVPLRFACFYGRLLLACGLNLCEDHPVLVIVGRQQSIRSLP